MKTDAQLKQDVLAELEWEAGINAANIGVAVTDGVVRVLGHVETPAEKEAVEHAVQRVAGVNTVAIELEVALPAAQRRGDAEIAEAAQSALRWHAAVTEETVRVAVERGWITLTGVVDRAGQRDAAYAAVRDLVDVVGVSNRIGIRPRA